MSDEMRRVALYIRVSTGEQAADGYSLDAQRRTLTDYCAARGYEIAQCYMDEGISGKDIKHRPEMRRLLKDAERRKFDMVLVWKLTRFTRSLSDLCAACDHLEKYGVTFCSYSESFDCSTPAGRMMRNVLGVIAQWEREVISENVQAAMAEMATQGYPTCSYILGYDVDRENKTLVIIPDEANLIREIEDVYLDTGTIMDVYRHCKSKDYRGKRGRPLRPESIRRILTRFTYAGYYSWHGRPIRAYFTPIRSPKKHNMIMQLLEDNGARAGRNRIHPLTYLPE